MLMEESDDGDEEEEEEEDNITMMLLKMKLWTNSYGLLVTATMTPNSTMYYVRIEVQSYLIPIPRGLHMISPIIGLRGIGLD